jgi:hypothetical protein
MTGTLKLRLLKKPSKKIEIDYWPKPLTLSAVGRGGGGPTP